eukprot:scaffold105105_cov62-Attheya_sp.AAC.2
MTIPCVETSKKQKRTLLLQVERSRTQMPETGAMRRTAYPRRSTCSGSLQLLPHYLYHVGILFLLVVCLLPLTVQTTTIFGTENGFDVGGTEPICFHSILNFTNDLQNENSTELIPTLQDSNENLFGGKRSSFEILRSCQDRTEMEVETVLDLGEDRLLENGRNYTFRVKLQVLLSELSNQIVLPTGNNSTPVHLRLILCNALQNGYCNPLQDTRELDQNMKPFQTDAGAAKELNFTEGASRWDYEEGKTLLGIVQERLIMTRWVKWNLEQDKDNSDLYSMAVDIPLLMPRGTPRGEYFLIGHVITSFNIGDGLVYRLDVAAAIPDFTVQLQDPPTINTMSDITKHQEHLVMKLAQGGFLAALAGSCMALIAFSFTYFPTNDMFCRLQGPLVLFPLTVVVAILVGRLWRVYVTLSAAIDIGRHRESDPTPPTRCSRLKPCQRIVSLLSLLAGVPIYLRHPQRRKSYAPSLRQKVTAKETVFGAVYYDRHVEFQLDENANIGRYMCSYDGEWTTTFGRWMIALMFVLAVMMAWLSRELPSAFNEKRQIFRATGISIAIGIVAAALAGGNAQDPTTDPDSVVGLRVMNSIGVATTVLVLVVWPKIRRVRSGEKVVMGSLFSGRSSDSRLSSSPAATVTNEYEVTVTGVPQHIHVVDRITLKKDDPLPRQLELDIFATQETLRGITEHCGDGRPLSLSDWKRMRADVTNLYNCIDRIELTWTNTDEAGGPAVSGMIDADADADAEAPVTAACSDTEAAPIVPST